MSYELRVMSSLLITQNLEPRIKNFYKFFLIFKENSFKSSIFVQI